MSHLWGGYHISSWLSAGTTEFRSLRRSEFEPEPLLEETNRRTNFNGSGLDPEVDFQLVLSTDCA